MAATIPARTSRTCRSSHPISTASSNASCANSFSSARFSFSTLIFSTQETGSPSGVRHTGNSIVSLSDILPLLGSAVLRSLALARLLLPRGGGKDHLPDQVFEADRRLGKFDLAARRDRLFFAARDERHVLLPEEAVGDDLGHRVLGQSIRRVDAHLYSGEKCLRVEGLGDDRPDFDPSDPHVAAVAQRADPLELGGHRI